MASKVQFQLDHAGVVELLQGPAVADLVDGLASRIVSNARGHLPDDVVVEADTFVTDRHVASVAIKDAAGARLQLKRGALTRAAGSVGLEVKSK